MAEHSVLTVVTQDTGRFAQEALHSHPYLAYVGFVVLSLTLISYYFDNYGFTDAREPKKLRPSVPFVGHLVGMMSRHTQYFDDLYKKNGVAIATLPMLGGKIYAIWDTALIQSGLNKKTMSFDAIMLQHAKGLLGLSEQSMHVARGGLLAELMHVTKPILAGKQLARINITVLDHAAVILNEIRAKQAHEVQDLYDWVQTTATLATSEALYGSANPFVRDRSLVDDVWSFETGLRKLAMDIFPSVTTPRAYRARERLVTTIAHLFDQMLDHKIELPELSRRRVEVIHSHGITDTRQMARIELALLHGATVNTAPTLFWTVAHVIARPELLTAIRNEALPLVKFTSASADGGQEAHFPMRLLDSSCPLLLSSYREVTRLVNKAMSTRQVMQDTTVADTHGREYLFRTGSTVMMPATAHSAAHVWGSDADEFRPERFLDWSDKAVSKASKERRAAYMPFGGGKHLCPGRNLAKAEILGVVVALTVMFEVEDTASPGAPIGVPEIRQARLGQGVGKPVDREKGKRIAARFKTRKGWENIKWNFVL